MELYAKIKNWLCCILLVGVAMGLLAIPLYLNLLPMPAIVGVLTGLLVLTGVAVTKIYNKLKGG